MRTRQLHWMWLIMLIVGLIPAIATSTEYPEELSFLAKTKLPDYLYVSGEITSNDSTGVSVLDMPFRFYWEKGNYAVDIRQPQGTPLIFARGIADTVWIYDFTRYREFICLREQNLGQSIGLPFTPRDILVLFNLYPQGFPSDIDTFYYEDSSIIVKVLDGAVYHFDEKSKLIRQTTRKNQRLTFSQYRKKRGFALPYQVDLNLGFLLQEAISTHVNILEFSAKRQKENNLLLSPEPINMKDAFDSRP